MKVTDEMVEAAAAVLGRRVTAGTRSLMRDAIAAAIAAGPRRPAAPPDPDSAIEQAIEDAADHGRESDPDMEVGDLQVLVRTLWSMLTPEQRSLFVDRWVAWG